MPEWHSFFELK